MNTDPSTPTNCYQVTTENQRLDQFLAAVNTQELSRANLQRLIKEGHVQVNGKQAVKASHKLHCDDRVSVYVPPPIPSKLIAQDIPIKIIYQDKYFLVIDKPAGMVVHPAPGHSSGTVVNAILHQCPDLAGIGGTMRPGIVHRLDKDTSGLMVIAKDDATHQYLTNLWGKRAITRRYQAILIGHLDDEYILADLPLGRHPYARKKMAVVPGGKDSRTHIRTKKIFPGFSLVVCSLDTGRTHQIRVHCAYLKHAVLGDITYGRASELIDRQALHATTLGFKHPQSGEPMTWNSPLPADMRTCLEQLAPTE